MPELSFYDNVSIPSTKPFITVSCSSLLITSPRARTGDHCTISTCTCIVIHLLYVMFIACAARCTVVYHVQILKHQWFVFVLCSSELFYGVATITLHSWMKSSLLVLWLFDHMLWLCSFHYVIIFFASFCLLLYVRCWLIFHVSLNMRKEFLFICHIWGCLKDFCSYTDSVKTQSLSTTELRMASSVSWIITVY